MYCRNYTATLSHVLCREVHCTVSLLERVHYQRFHCILKLEMNLFITTNVRIDAEAARPMPVQQFVLTKYTVE